MDPEGFKRARELFDGALDRSGDERRAFLKDACGSDQGLLEQVERLLRFAEREDDQVSTDERAAAPHGVSVGMLAPAFDLPCVSVGSSAPRRVSLSSFCGRWLVLVFYPRDFSLVCPTELTALSNRTEEFGRCGADILGVSVDSIESHERWLRTPTAHRGIGGLNFPLASDEDGAVSRAYGVYLEQQHVSLRGLFLIDPNGVLQFQAVHNLSIGRRSDDILRVLSALQTGG
ncbi:MAG: peroxiredoxin, partial [Phycisphaerales bacterium]